MRKFMRALTYTLKEWEMERGIRVDTARYKMLDGSIRKLVKKVGDGSIISRFDKTTLPTKPTDVVCPHFLELKWANGCPYRCAWCYLQGTFRFHPMKKRPRVKDRELVRRHLEAFFDFQGSAEILNTGELADSLMTEHKKEPFSDFVLPLFENQQKHKVLFLSKSPYIWNFLKYKENGQAVMSFSLNAETVAKKWEKAPDIDSRIEAAKQVSNAGYETRIRIDPIVPYGNWQESYKKLIDKIFNKFKPNRITIGSLRGLQSTINQAVDKTWVKYLSEWSNWGRKMAFDLRFNMYSTVLNYLKEDYDYTNVALCKETVEMWNALSMNYTTIRCNCTL